MAGLVPMRPGIGGPVSLVMPDLYMVSDPSVKRSKPTSVTRGLSNCSNVRQQDYLSCRRWFCSCLKHCNFMANREAKARQTTHRSLGARSLGNPSLLQSMIAAYGPDLRMALALRGRKGSHE